MTLNDERKLYLRIYATILIGMFLALVAIRLFALAMGASGSSFLGRVLEARENLPAVMEQPGDAVMVFGSSMVHAGFSARHFDKLMAEKGGNVKSWNFGFGGLNPYFQDYLSRRIREEYEAEGKRLRLALIEFNPFQTTQTRWEGAEMIRDSYITLLASNDELWQMAKEDPERGALLFNIKYLRDNVSAEMATTFFGRQLFGERPQRSDRPGLSEEEQERLDEISEDLNARFEVEYPDFVSHEWGLDWQGAGTVPWERPQETVDLFPEYYSLLQNEERMHNDLLFRIRTADAVELNFEELLVEHFIQVVENFKMISDEVEVILLPRNTDWIEYTPEVAARLQSVVERIERETGVRVVNQQVIDAVPPSAFSDTTHLGRYVGDIPWTEYLVEQYGERLLGE